MSDEKKVLTLAERGELLRLKVKAKNLAERADRRCGDGGEKISDAICADRTIARRELREIWPRIMELDPKAPALPERFLRE